MSFINTDTSSKANHPDWPFCTQPSRAFSSGSHRVSSLAFHSLPSTSLEEIRTPKRKREDEFVQKWSAEEEGSISSDSDVDASDKCPKKSTRQELRRQDTTLEAVLIREGLRSGMTTPPPGIARSIKCPDSDKSTKSNQSDVGLDFSKFDFGNEQS